MNQTLKDLQPQLLWKHFGNLCAAPHPSKKESKAIELVRNFAVAQNLDYIVDETGNVIIWKPATPGMENRPGIVLQAHLDMVPQKDSNIDHDFEHDPIKTYIDGDWVKARGTTLGADNGIGVAAALAVLESKDIVHSPLEVLLTVDEETGMTGANGLKPDILRGSLFINLDSEEEGELFIGCAGGINAKITMDYTSELAEKNMIAFNLQLSGLKGGHSGLEINLGRGNANKIFNRFLWNATRNYDLRIASIEGGNMRNAIPREATAVVAISADKEEIFKQHIADFLKTITAELDGVEENISFTATPVACPATVMNKQSQSNLLDLIYGIPNGAIRMIADKPEVVETSTNLAIIKSDGACIHIACLLRSSVDSAKEDLADSMIAVCSLAGASITFDGSYPGWKPNFDSSILKTMRDVYQKLYDKPAIVKVIHAGLECGIFGKNYPDMDYISFGPTIEHPHSPGEQVNIPSVARFWDYLVETLKSV